MSRRLDDEAGDGMMRRKKLVHGKRWLLNKEPLFACTAPTAITKPTSEAITNRSGVDIFGVEGFRKRSHGSTRVGKQKPLPRAA